MPNQPPLNPDALENAYGAARSHEPSYKASLITVEELSERVIRAYLAVAQPVVNSVEELVTTRVGLALANAAFKEGLSAGIRACNESLEGEPFVKPVSPYSAPLLAMIKADRPEVKP